MKSNAASSSITSKCSSVASVRTVGEVAPKHLQTAFDHGLFGDIAGKLRGR